MSDAHTDPNVQLLPANRSAASLQERLVICALLVAMIVAVYVQVWRFDFVTCWDDHLYVVDNVRVQSGLTWAGIKWSLTSMYETSWTPLTWMSLMLDSSVYQNWAGGYHLTSVAIHALNALLVYAFLVSATGYSLRSAFVAALFAIHPLHVESVTWISERKDVLSMFFGLLTLCAYVRYARQPGFVSYGFVVLMYFFSLASKPTLVTLPFVLLLIDVWPLHRLNKLRNSVETSIGPWSGKLRLVLEKVPLLALSIGSCAMTVYAQAKNHSVHPLSEITFVSRLANAVLAYALYLKKAVLPVKLAFFYPHPGNQFDMRDVATAAACLVAITMFVFVVSARRRDVLVGWLWFLGSMVPMIGLVQVGGQQMADRYAYFPLLGIYMAVAWLAPSLFDRPFIRHRLLPTVATCAVVAYATIAYFQVGYWRDGETLTRRALAVTENNSFATRLLGDALFLQGRSEEAIVEYRRAIELAPYNPKLPARLASAFRSLGRLEEAEEQVRLSLALNERDCGTHVAMASLLITQRRYSEAQQELVRAQELDDRNPWVYVHMASLCRMKRDYPQSFACCQRALEFDEGLLICHRIIALNLRDQGRPAEAQRWLESVVAQPFIDRETRQLLAELSSFNAIHSVAGE